MSTCLPVTNDIVQAAYNWVLHAMGLSVVLIYCEAALKDCEHSLAKDGIYFLAIAKT